MPKSLQRSSITVNNVAVASLRATLLPAIAAAEFIRPILGPYPRLMHSFSTFRTRVVFGLVLLALSTAAPGLAEVDSGRIEVELRTDQGTYELGQGIRCQLEVRNGSQETILLPDLSHGPVKSQQSMGVWTALQNRRLRMQLSTNGRITKIPTRSRRTDEMRLDQPMIQLGSGEVFSESFYLPNTSSIKQPGDFRLQVKVQVGGTTPTRFISASTQFAIVEVPCFREKDPAETNEDYAKKRVDFFLSRIIEYQGRYLRNVGEIIRMSGGIPALIQHLDSDSPEKAAEARFILARIRFSSDQSSPEERMSKDPVAWREWWMSDGIKLNPREMWQRFDGFIQ